MQRPNTNQKISDKDMGCIIFFAKCRGNHAPLPYREKFRDDIEISFTGSKVYDKAGKKQDTANEYKLGPKKATKAKIIACRQPWGRFPKLDMHIVKVIINKEAATKMIGYGPS